MGATAKRLLPVLIGGLLVAGLTVVGVSGSEGATRGVTQEADPITNVEPFPDAIVAEGPTKIFAELERRFSDWTEQISAQEMSSSELAQTIDKIRFALAELEDGPTRWLTAQELGYRVASLCLMLPKDHEYRGGEFCS